MQGSSKTYAGSRVRIAIVVLAMGLLSLAGYSVYRLEKVEQGLSQISQIYSPIIRELNVFDGKWSTYQKTFEQSVAFRDWGTSKYRDRLVRAPKLNLLRLSESHLSEIQKTIKASQEGGIREFAIDRAEALARDIEQLASNERFVLAELATLVQNGSYAEAADRYSKTKTAHAELSQRLGSVVHDLEVQSRSIREATHSEVRSTQALCLFLMAAVLLALGFVLARMARWTRPLYEWTRVAQEISLHGLHKGIVFPNVLQSDIEEFAVLTREFTRMAHSVLERERTIHMQKSKLEALNTMLKTQNEFSEALVQSMSSGLVVIDREGTIRRINRSVDEKFGGSIALGQNFRDVFLFLSDDLMAQIISGKTLISQRVRSRDSSRWFSISTSCLEQNSIAGEHTTLIMIDDVTAIVEAEDRAAHRDRLDLAGQLASQVAHEVRNPLNSMVLQLEMLDEDVAQNQSQKDVRDRIRVITEQVSHLERITDRYLKISKGQEQRQSLVTSRFDIVSILEKVLIFLRSDFQANHVTVVLAGANRAIFVNGDADAVAQVFYNLFKNSVEAMISQSNESRELRINIKSEMGNVIISVSDTGVGVHDTVQNQIFEPFVTTKSSGHGLGLSVSRQVCIAHGGDLVLTDARTATFEVRLPKCADKQQSIKNIVPGELHENPHC